MKDFDEHLQSLGPATEARFARAFEDGALITKQAAAQLLGLDVGTLDALTTDGVIRAVPRGKRRAYTEHELRAFLLGATSPPAEPKRKLGRALPAPKTINFSQRHAFAARANRP